MASFVSATLGISLSITLLAIAWARETPWDRALYHAALTGGAAAVLGRYWVRQMIRAARETQRLREEEARKQAAEAAAASNPAPGSSQSGKTSPKAG